MLRRLRFSMETEDHSAVAELPVDVKSLSTEKMKVLRQHQSLLKELDAWTLIANRDQLPELRKLADVVNKLYHFPPTMLVYRGFDPSSVQESLGLAVPGFFFNTVREHRLGEVFQYASKASVVSFSRSLTIARAFGPTFMGAATVVSTVLNLKKTPALIYTDELAALVSERRGLKKIMTQQEVILFPPFDQSFTIVQVN